MDFEKRAILKQAHQIKFGVSFLALTLVLFGAMISFGDHGIQEMTIASLFGGKSSRIDERLFEASEFIRNFPLWTLFVATGCFSSVLYFSRSLTKKWHRRFIESTMHGYFGGRWLNRGIVSVFLITLLSLLTGVFQESILLAIVVLQVIGHVFLNEMERSNRMNVRPDWAPCLIAWLIFILQVGILLFAGFSVGEMMYLPIILRFFVAGFFLFKSVLLVNNMFHHASVAVWSRTVNVEISYMILDYSVLIFAGVLFYLLTTLALLSS